VPSFTKQEKVISAFISKLDRFKLS